MQVLVALSLTCPHPPVDGHLSLHPGPPHTKCRGYQGLRPDLSLPLFLLHSGQVGANLGKILCDLGPLPQQTVVKLVPDQLPPALLLFSPALLLTRDPLQIFKWLATDGDWHLTNTPTSRLNAR